MTLKRVTIRNIQSILETTFTFPEHGTVLFVGDNSNGKSVFFKVTQGLIYGLINNPKERRSLVCKHTGQLWGEIEYERYDGMIFLAHIHLEAAQTYFELQRPGSTERNRSYLSAKLLPKYVEEFGFHYNKNRNISLNMCDGDEAMLFFKTSYVTNSEILEPALTDNNAAIAYERLNTIVADAQDKKRAFTHQIEVTDAAIEGLHIYDTEVELKRCNNLKYLLKNLQLIKFPKLRKLEPVPDIQLIEIKSPVIQKLVSPIVIDASLNLQDLISPAKEYMAIREGKCPTCGKSLIECED